MKHALTRMSQLSTATQLYRNLADVATVASAWQAPHNSVVVLMAQKDVDMVLSFSLAYGKSLL